MRRIFLLSFILKKIGSHGSLMLDAGHAKSMLCDDLEGGVGKVMGVYRMEGTKDL